MAFDAIATHIAYRKTSPLDVALVHPYIYYVRLRYNGVFVSKNFNKYIFSSHNKLFMTDTFISCLKIKTSNYFKIFEHYLRMLRSLKLKSHKLHWWTTHFIDLILYFEVNFTFS